MTNSAVRKCVRIAVVMQLAVCATRIPCVWGASLPGPEGVQLSADEARVLCTQNVSGSSDAVRALPMTAQQWVRVGWEWVRRARRSGDPGFYVNARACADGALRSSPESIAPRELRSVVLMNDHRFAAARAEAERILAVDASNSVALGTLSDALLELGRFEEAVTAAQRGADAQPGALAYVRASYLRWLTGDVAGAKHFIRSALAGRDPRDPEPTAWTFVEAAKIFWHEADYAGADAVLGEALRWVPDYPPALVARARVALSQKEPERAIGYLEKAYRLQPFPEAAWLLADARGLLGDAAGADAERRRVVQSGRRGDRLTLALFYATKNFAIDDALRLIEEERTGRGGVYVDDTYAWVLYRAGRIPEARVASERAVRLGTPDARILYHAGAIQMASGMATGRALIENALALNPEFDVTSAAEARALLAMPVDVSTAADGERAGRRDS
jgi:tetratricopeptide (TPR) repeat protein